VHADLLDLVNIWHNAHKTFLQWLRVRKGIDEAWMARDNTRAAYRSATLQFLYGAPDLLRTGFRPPRPWEATSADALAYKDALTYTGKSPATINQRMAGLKTFYSYIRDKYRIPNLPALHKLVVARVLFPDENDPKRLALLDPTKNNPFNASKIERLKVKPFGRSKYPTRREMDDIFNQIKLDTLNGLRDYALLYTIITTHAELARYALSVGGISPSRTTGSGSTTTSARDVNRDGKSSGRVPGKRSRPTCTPPAGWTGCVLNTISLWDTTAAPTSVTPAIRASH
jgi:integrase